MMPAINEVDLWVCVEPQQPDEDREAAWLALLNAEELGRWQRLARKEDQRRFLLARALVRTTVAGYVANPNPAALVFVHNAYAKPALHVSCAADGKPPHFNLSHTRGLAVLAVSRQLELGVDVEDTRRVADIQGLTKRYFAACEYEQLQRHQGSAKADYFFRLWTLKEAYLKALGLGLRVPLAEFSFTLDTKQGATVSHPGVARCDQDWYFRSLVLARHFRLALAVPLAAGDELKLRIHTGLPLAGFTEIALQEFAA